MKSAILLSGGLDSTVALLQALDQPQRYTMKQAYLFDYCQRAFDSEYTCAKATCDRFGLPLKVLNLGDLPPSGLTDPFSTDFEVPFRNVVMIATAASHCMREGYAALVTGCIYEDGKYGFSDNRPEVLEPLAQCLGGVELVHILHGQKKSELFSYADKTGNLLWVLNKTHTSYSVDRTAKYPWGYGPTILDDPCRVRRTAWEEYDASKNK